MNSPKLEITEPGYQPALISVKERWGEYNILGIGRKDNDYMPMVVFRDPPQALSRSQVTVTGVEGADGLVLWVRDGGPKFQGEINTPIKWGVINGQPEIGADNAWKKSAYGTWINQEVLSPYGWTVFRVSDLLTFGRELKYPMLAGYSIRHTIEETGGTGHNAGTVSYSAAEVWRQESRRAKTEGTMLLTVPSSKKSLAVIQEIDSTAELILGASPGELQDAEGSISLQDQFLFEQEIKLNEMVSEAMVYDRSFVGNFTTISGQEISLNLRRRIINNEPPVLFAWLALNVNATEASAPQSDWKAEAVKFANQHPWIAALVGIAIAIIFFLLSK